MSEFWLMSVKEIDRLEIIQLVIAKRLSVTRAAKQMGLSRGHASRLVNAYRPSGNNSAQKLSTFGTSVEQTVFSGFQRAIAKAINYSHFSNDLLCTEIDFCA